MLAEDSTVMAKTKELCAAIAEDAEYKGLLETVETFLNDDSAKSQYQSVHQRGEELQQKQGAGIELSDAEVSEFESAREALLANPVAKGFLDAQHDLQSVQMAIGKYVGMTLELGRVPQPEDMQSEGCCGEGGGGG
jgi:cell fate (sporulation/competence/biofilm development) regulator YlbF (YheA/YmcA/DUF963 family)